MPAAVGALLRRDRAAAASALALLALQRARHQRHTATIAVAGVVASLALAVALTVMVASFRDSVTHWLDTVLPADLYVRTAQHQRAPTARACRPQLAARGRRAARRRAGRDAARRAVQLDPTGRRWR